MRSIKFRAWNKATEEMLEWPFETFEVYPDGSFEVNGYMVDDSEDGVALMQFTCLKDCKGNDIYEGDIMGIGIVKWVDNYAAFKVMAPAWEHDMFFASHNLEVTGNIYENPEHG